MKFKNIYLGVILLIISCKTTENKKTNTSETQMNQKQMIADGYKKGVVIASDKEGDCPYVIKLQVNDTTHHYDPVDLPDAYKDHEKKIWFKFTPSRRPNRCNNANPVILNNEIQSRK